MRHEEAARYAAALQFFVRILQAPPDEELLRGAAGQDLMREFATWSCFGKPPGKREGRDPQAAFGALAKACAQVRESADALARTCREARQDHLRLFSGPDPKAPPWESVWRERDGLLFGERTAEVQACYARWGVSIVNQGREPEDHLGYELAFALFLLQAMAEEAAPARADGPGVTDGTGRAGDPADSRARSERARKALAAFLEDHLLPWAGDCLERASREAVGVFYRELPLLCLNLLRNLYAFVCRCQAEHIPAKAESMSVSREYLKSGSSERLTFFRASREV